MKVSFVGCLRKLFMFIAIVTFSIQILMANPLMSAEAIMEKMDAQQRLVSHGTFSLSQISTCPFSKNNKKIVCVENPRIKLMESVSKQYGEHQKDSKNISVLLKPASEKGISMLSYSYDDSKKDSETWLYLSALGKVKRIASGASEDQEPTAIFGSEFSTEDMESGKTREYTYNILQEGAYGKRQVWVVESIPIASRIAKTHYSKLLFWVDKERFIPLKIQTYDKRGNLYKRLLFKNIVNLKGSWLAKDVTVLNLKTQRLSNMKTKNIALNVTVLDAFLTQRTLTDFAFREKHLIRLREQVQ